MNVTIYHNPRCSKSREALSILREHGAEPVVVEYLKTPIDRAGIERLLALLGLEPRQLMRTHEEEYKKAGLDDPTLSREALIDALVMYPRLIERPIVVRDERHATIGRPPERILDIL